VRLRFTKLALADLDEVRTYLAARNPRAAAATATGIRRAVRGLTTFPERGRMGRIDGTRELVVPTTPFLVVDRVGEREVEVLAIMHGARRWPESL
jgi:toxin ParE1/3/4